MDKKTFIEGIAVGAVAGAIAGLLLAPKSGQETREEISAELTEIKDKLVTRLEKLEDCTKEKYDEAVAAIVAEYSAAKKIPAEQAEELEAKLRDGYDTILKTIHDHTNPGPSTTEA
ncbi:MAG: YtxH domain-containing protein [Armatimonadota bacterium]